MTAGPVVDPRVDDGSGGASARPASWAARAVTVVVAVVALGLVYLLVTSDTGDEARRASPLLDELVPPLSGTTLDGSTFDIDDHRDRWVLVNFFASWCIPCQEEHPELAAFSEGHGELGDAVVVAVPFDNREEDVRAFFAERGGAWPVLMQDQQRAAVNFGVTGVPESFLVAPGGTVVAHYFQVTERLLDDTIDSLLGRGGG